MRIPPAARGRHIGSRFFRRVIGVIAALSMFGWLGTPVPAQVAASRVTSPVAAEFHEPVTLASKDGVLEVRLIARQGAARLDTAAAPVKNFLLFDYEVIRGTASDGQMSGGSLYPAPTLQVFPGETMIIHLENRLSDLTIRDYFSPQYTAKGETVPIYPEQMTSSPLNLHIHGVHISPRGNADNVLLHIPAGMSNTYTYNIPKSMPGSILVSQPPARPDRGANLFRPCRPALDRPLGRQPAAGHTEQHSRSKHGAAIQFRLRSRQWPCAAQQPELAAIRKLANAAARR
jgi:FtsP/CotA-like multicopper oxidase with cupredoxin domain